MIVRILYIIIIIKDAAHMHMCMHTYIPGNKRMPTLIRTLLSLKRSTSIAAALLFSNVSRVSTVATSSSPGCTVNSFGVQGLMAQVNESDGRLMC